MNRSDSPKMSLSIDKFCELYNDVPKVLVAYATMVNLSAETYRKTTAQIIFEEENNSNYWIIPVANTANDAWLVPNPSRKVNYATLKSLPFAFESNNQENLKQLSSFTLSEPAQVMSLPTEPTTWKLIKRGIIFFGDVGQQNKELQDIINSIEIEEMVKSIVNKQLMEFEQSLSILYREVKNQQIKMTAIVNQQNDKNPELNDQSNSTGKISENHERQVQDLTVEQQRQAGEISILKLALINQSISMASDSIALSTNTPKIVTSTSELSFTTEELDLLRKYNSNSHEVPKSLRDGSKNVSIADEAVARIRDGNLSNITFKLNRSGNFLIISRGGYCYLVPNKQRKIIPQMYTIAQAIYKCDGYSENYQDFRLIKPALLSEEPGDCWELREKGILEFSPGAEVTADVVQLAYPSLVTYRRSVNIFKNQYNPKTVAEDIDSFQKRSAGNHQDMILREYHHGLYWLFNESSLIYLIPAPNWKTNYMNMQTAKNFFDCENHTRGHQSMTIVSPAVVSAQLGSNERWKLEQKGILEFI
jgi:hypothetical protein